MVNKNKILSDLSKFAVDAMGAFSGLKEEIETIVSLRVDKVIKKMNLVKKDEFEVLKKMVQKLSVENANLKNTGRKKAAVKKKVTTTLKEEHIKKPAKKTGAKSKAVTSTKEIQAKGASPKKGVKKSAKSSSKKVKDV